VRPVLGADSSTVGAPLRTNNKRPIFHQLSTILHDLLWERFTFTFTFDNKVTRKSSRLRYCATSRMVAGSIPVGVIWIFHSHNPSGRTMALGLTQPLTEIGTRNITWGVKAADA